MRFVDMHTHTTASDGSMTPTELVAHAKETGLSAVAITDHDTLEGLHEAKEAGVKYGIEVVCGIEIGVEFSPEMHILGYFFNDGYEIMQPVLNKLKENRDKRNPKIIKKLNQMGFDISLEEAVNEAHGTVVGRPHIAKILMKKGYVKSIREAFDLYLSSGRPAYFKKDRLTPYQGITEIRKAGGLPVLAHPMYLNLDFSHLDDLLMRMKIDGLVGLEAYYSEQDEQSTRKFEMLAEKNGLCITGGSDFHGRFKPEIQLGKTFGGKSISYELLEKLKSNVNKLK